MQIYPVSSELFFKRTQLLHLNINIYCKLMKLPYGMSEAGPQRTKVSDGCMNYIG